MPRPMPLEPPATRTVKLGRSFTVEGSVGPEGVWCCGGANRAPEFAGRFGRVSDGILEFEKTKEERTKIEKRKVEDKF